MNNDKIINSFKIKIPNYSSDNSNDIPKLNCLYEIKINEDLIIYIIIDALIKLDISQLFMYDFYTKKYVQNEATIHLNVKVKETLQKKNTKIKLQFLLFSIWENEKFLLISIIVVKDLN